MRKFIVLATLLSLSAAAGAATIEMKVDGLVCAFCAQGIEKTLKTNPAVGEVFVSLKRKVVAVATKDGQDVSDEALKEALKEAGDYKVTAVTRSERTLAQVREALK